MTTNKELEKNVNGLSEKLEAVVESSNQVFDDLDKKIDQKFDSISSSMSEILETFKSTRAKDSPVVIRDAFEPLEQDLGSEDAVEFDDNNIVLPRQGLQDVDSPEAKAKNDHEAFMRQMVTVSIHEKAGRNAENVFPITVDGKQEIFIGGQEKSVKRMYVEGLARAKPLHYGNDEYIDNKGIQRTRWPVSKSLRHGFSVVHDPDPRGAAWLKGVLAQP